MNNTRGSDRTPAPGQAQDSGMRDKDVPETSVPDSSMLSRMQAYADGALSDAEAAEVQALIAADPALAAALAREQRLRARLREAFAPVLAEPIPERFAALLAADEMAEAAGAASATASETRSAAAVSAPVHSLPASAPQAQVVPLPARAASRRAVWPAYALAASVAVLALGWGWRGLQAPVHVRDGVTVAGGALARGLNDALASAPSAQAEVAVGLSFRGRDGRICRSFSVRASSMSGLACREGERWQLPVLVQAEGASSAPDALRQASLEIAPAVQAEIDARIDGDAFDADQERAAQGRGWR